MRPSGAALLPLVIVGALAGLTFWLDKAASGQEQTARANKRHDPDFFVEKFNVQRYDATGQLINSLVADKMTHFPMTTPPTSSTRTSPSTATAAPCASPPRPRT